MAVALLVTGPGARTASAQRPAATELSVGAAGAVATRDFWGGELGIARGTRGPTRLAATVAAGTSGGAAAVRFAIMGQLSLAPAARDGTGPYAGLGLSFLGARGGRGAGYLCAVLGLEAAPGRGSGWYAEAGLGGGVRVAAGWRWRRLPAGR